MPEPEVEINGKKFDGSTQIVLNVKAVIAIISLVVIMASTIFGVVNSKLNAANSNINVLEEKVDGYNTTVTTVQAQNEIILQHYGIDIGIEAEEAARARRNSDGRPSSLNGN